MRWGNPPPCRFALRNRRPARGCACSLRDLVLAWTPPPHPVPLPPSGAEREPACGFRSIQAFAGAAPAPAMPRNSGALARSLLGAWGAVSIRGEHPFGRALSSARHAAASRPSCVPGQARPFAGSSLANRRGTSACSRPIPPAAISEAGAGTGGKARCAGRRTWWQCGTEAAAGRIGTAGPAAFRSRAFSVECACAVTAGRWRRRGAGVAAAASAAGRPRRGKARCGGVGAGRGGAAGCGLPVAAE